MLEVLSDAYNTTETYHYAYFMYQEALCIPTVRGVCGGTTPRFRLTDPPCLPQFNPIPQLYQKKNASVAENDQF